jgi:hypothetical protein
MKREIIIKKSILFILYFLKENNAIAISFHFFPPIFCEEIFSCNEENFQEIVFIIFLCDHKV